MKKIIYLLIAMSTISVSAQVGIGVETSNINASAQLDVSSTTKGFLAPRMTSAQKEAISTPAAGLLVYQTDGTSGFYYYNGTTWTAVTADASSAGIPYTGATAAVDLGAYDLTVNGLTIGQGATADLYNTAIGISALATNTSGGGNTAIGVNALNLNTEGNLNIAIGALALTNNTIGSENSAIGFKTLNLNTEGSSNTAIGTFAMINNTIGNSNTATGESALGNNRTGNNNTANGNQALLTNSVGNNNTAMGSTALSDNGEGSDNTAIGSGALMWNQGSGNSSIGAGSLITLTLGNYNTAIGASTDITYGTLSNTTAIGYGAKVAASNTIQLGNIAVTAVKTSGKLTTGTVTYPNTNGTANQVLTTDGAGNATWATAAVVTPGVDLTTNQTVAGLKTFSNAVTVGGASSTTSAIVEVASTTQGFLPPRMTNAQKVAIASPVAGLVLWCTNCGTKGELQVYNGTEWTNMIGGTVATVPVPVVVAIGDLYQGGKVAYILQAGDPGYDANVQHGLIIATSTLGDKALGDVSSTSIAPGTSEAIGSGFSNTNAIVTAFPAFDGAAQLVRASTLGGYSDWYLPSFNEGKRIMLNYVILNLGVNTAYSGSSQRANCDSDCQMMVDFGQPYSPKLECSIMVCPEGLYAFTPYLNINDTPISVLPVRSF